jgi:hypothetical protein
MVRKRQRFIELAEARVTRALNAIRVIGNLSNRANYEYSGEDVEKILGALRDELALVEARFCDPEVQVRPDFKLVAE